MLASITFGPIDLLNSTESIGLMAPMKLARRLAASQRRTSRRLCPCRQYRLLEDETSLGGLVNSIAYPNLGLSAG